MARPQKPKVNSDGQKQLDEAQEKFDAFEKEVKDLTMDRMNQAPVEESDPQTKMSAKEWKEAPEIYLKPVRTQYPGPIPKTGVMTDKFNENYRKDWEYDKELVRFIAENNEIVGETISIWTRPYPGLPAEQWEVPTNKPVWGPRYLAEQIRRKCYHRLTMDNRVIESGTVGTITGGIVAQNTVHRLNAQSAPKGHIAMNRRVSNF